MIFNLLLPRAYRAQRDILNDAYGFEIEPAVPLTF